MALAVPHPHSRRRGKRIGAAEAGTAPVTTRWPRGLSLVGGATLLLGAWGALVPFIGPGFGYGANGAGSWQWSAMHAFLYLIPGAVAFVAGIALLACARGSRLLTRAAVGFLGLVVAVCGAWFVLGPSIWPIIGSGSAVVFAADKTALDHFTTMLGYNLGIGVVLAALGGMAMAASVAEREVALAETAQTPAPWATQPVQPAAPAPQMPVAPTQGLAPVQTAAPAATVAERGDAVDEDGRASFPASDAPSHWPGTLGEPGTAGQAPPPQGQPPYPEGPPR